MGDPVTTKLMFLLHDGAGLRDDSLRDEGLRSRLAGAGATRVQVNLDDEHVGDALRLQPEGEEAYRAVLSVWTQGPPAAAADVVLASYAGAVGWQVEERRPLDPPETADGSRADALANVAVLRRPDELPHQEWLARWLGPHTTVAIETQATFGYLQNVVVGPVTPGAPRVDAIVEELFPAAAVGDVHAFYGSGGDDAELTRRITRLMESVASIGADRDLHLVPTSRYLYALGSSA
ncbi:MAG: hypothetical protein ACXVGD_22270 [Blastococcus sp.]